MLDIDIIDNTIKELEDSETTFFNCQNLAALYIVRDKLGQTKLDKELFDIIPTYKKYCADKKKYQLQEVSEKMVIEDLRKVCKEIKEFVNTLYSHSDIESERNEIQFLINGLYEQKR